MVESEQAATTWWERYRDEINEDLDSLVDQLQAADDGEEAVRTFVDAYEGTAALERGELDGFKSVETLREAHDACKSYLNGDVPLDTVIDVVTDEARVSSMPDAKSLLLFIVLTVATVVPGKAVAGDGVPAANLEPLEVVVEEDLHTANVVPDAQQIYAYGNGVYSVPRVVLTVLAEQVGSTGGAPRALHTGSGAWLDQVDLSEYALSLMQQGLSVQEAMQAQRLVQSKEVILVASSESADETSLIRHELAHRVIHNLDDGELEVLREARSVIIDDFEEKRVKHESPITGTTWTESYVSVVFGEYEIAVLAGDWSEIWAYLVQDRAFTSTQDAMSEVQSKKFFSALSNLSDEERRVVQRAIQIMLEVQRDVEEQLSTLQRSHS